MVQVPVGAFPEVLRNVARQLRETGDTDLVRQLRHGIADATSPVLVEIREGLHDYMPNRYADVLAADLRLTTSQRIAGKTVARVILRARSRGPGRRRVDRLERGELDHMLFGNRKRWFSQSIRPHFFSTPIDRSRSQIRRKIATAMNEVAEEAARRSG